MEEYQDKNKIWNGLNNPCLKIDDADIRILGLPFDRAASYRRGAAEAPARIRHISRHIPPTTAEGKSLEMIRVLDLGNVEPENLDQAEYFELVKAKAAAMLRSGFSTFIGGDHSVSIPLIDAASEIWGKNLCIIHLDAHLDLCHELDGNLLSHGCTQRRILEKNDLPLGQVWFIGIRSFEIQELQFLESCRPNIITADQICQLGIEAAARRVLDGLAKSRAVYLTIDIDFLDPAYAPGTGTPKPGGFSTRELLAMLKLLCLLPLAGMDLVEVSPPLDHNDITTYAAQRVITETWGYLFA